MLQNVLLLYKIINLIKSQMLTTNTYKQVLDQTLNNAWQLDAYIWRATCENIMEI